MFLAAFGAEGAGQNAFGEIHAAVTLSGIRRGGTKFLQNRFRLFAAEMAGRLAIAAVTACTSSSLRCLSNSAET